jgi:hypothetical protein
MMTLFKGRTMKASELKRYMRPFTYEDERITHLLSNFDDYVHFIKNYDENFELDDKKHEPTVLAGYRNSAFGILYSLFQLGFLTSQDFHMRMHALNTVFYEKVKV